MRQRDYTPDLGRWLVRDDLGYASGFNLYEAMASTPHSHSDPLGLQSSVTTTQVAGAWMQGPPALLVSWVAAFSGRDKGAAIADLYLKLLDKHAAQSDSVKGRFLMATSVGLVLGIAATANPTPPPFFATRGTFGAFDASKQHRGWILIEPSIKCCDGDIIDDIPGFTHDPGWTPFLGIGVLRTPYGYGLFPKQQFSKAENHPQTGVTYSDSGSCRTYTAFGASRVGPWFGAGMRAATGGFPVPWITRRIYYTICCDGRVSIEYAGSFFPSHRAYVGGPLSPAWAMGIATQGQDATRFGTFATTPIIQPTTFAGWIGSTY
jgi:hypothetical protein